MIISPPSLYRDSAECRHSVHRQVSRWHRHIPVSSSRVHSASIGPCFKSLASITAMMAAIPSPSSAPSVVPLLLPIHPSIYVSIGSVSNTCFAFFRFLRAPYPCVPATEPSCGFHTRSRRLAHDNISSWSLNASTPIFLAKSSKNCCTLSKCPDGRGFA